MLWSFLIGFSPLQAEQKVLTLEEALDLAIKANPEILQAKQEIEAWRGRTWQLSSWPSPEITFSREGLNFGQKKGEEEVNFNLYQLIEFPGKRALRREFGQQGIEAAIFRLETIKRIVFSQVKKAYYQVALSQETLNYYRTLSAFLEESLGTAQFRYEAGEVSFLDILRLELERLRLQNEIIQTEKETAEKWANLSLLLGGELKEKREVVVDLKFQPLNRSLEELLDEAKKRSSLAALNQEVKKFQTQGKIASKSLLPDFRLGFFYPSLRINSWGFEIGTTLPLGRAWQKGAVAEAAAQQKQAEIALEFLAQKIVASITTVFNRIRSLERRLELFEQTLLKEARSMLNLAISLYAQGKAGFLDLLDVYRLNREIYLSYLNTLFEHYLALAEIEVAGELE
ncbi:MAG: TolC family protein [Candidatus Aminicenantes bacterium]|nr:TolC family protein [Candidatus Aminicenantes bacterium]